MLAALNSAIGSLVEGLPEPVLAGLLDRAHDALIVLCSVAGTHDGGQIVWLNSTAAGLADLPRDRLTGGSLDLVLGEGAGNEGLRAALAEARSFEGIASLRDPHRGELVFDASLTPIEGAGRHMVLSMEPRRAGGRDAMQLIELLRFCSGSGVGGLYLLAVGDGMQPARLWADRRAAHLLGPGDARAEAGEDWLGCVHPEDRPLLRPASRQWLDGRETILRYRVAHHEGGYRFVVDRCRPAGHGRDGTIRLVVGAVAAEGGREPQERVPQHAAAGLEEEARPFGVAARPVEIDGPTGLFSRDAFEQRVSAALRRARGRRGALAVMRLAVDQFARVNESFGFAAGDAVLRSVGERLARALPVGGVLARLGSDEFLALVEGFESGEAIAEAACAMVEAVRPPFVMDGRQAALTASLGVALFPRDGDDCDELLHKAGMALDRAREEGRNRHRLFTNELNATPLERLLLESRLREALEKDEFVVHYQPQACLQTGRIVGVEALLRWNHPKEGLVPPGDFIPLAEETGLIVPIGAWVLEAACRDMQRWSSGSGAEGLRLAVNLSARQFQQTDLVAVVDDILARTGFPARQLEIELTESIVMSDAATATRKLRQLAALGLGLAIDDFGTGYSSLSYLRKFPISALKIDRSFIQDIDGDPYSAAIVQMIISLAAVLDLRVVGEGVETEQQLRQLRLVGCHEMQGYLLSRPVPLDRLTQALREAPLVVEV